MRKRCPLLPTFRLFLIVTALAGLLHADDSSPSTSSEPTATDQVLRQELLLRQRRDQASRQKVIEAVKVQGGEWNEAALSDPLVKPLAEEMNRIDHDNRRWLGRVIDRQGWPLISQVGEDGAQAAFLIVQHAVDDLAFQKRCLSLVQAAPEGEVGLPDVALLTDRVRLAEGQKQLYGSQVERQNGDWVLRPTLDPDNLDTRRAKMGLPPMSVYLKLLDEVYGTADAEPVHADDTSPRR